MWAPGVYWIVELVSIASVSESLLYLEIGQVRQNSRRPQARRALQFANNLKRFTNRIMKGGPDLANQLALPVGPGAVCEQSNRKSAIQVNP